jgi:hypothetical protein
MSVRLGHARLRNGQESPVAGGLPFPLELGSVLFEKLSLRGIVDEDDLLRLIETRDDDVVKQCAGLGFQRDNQRPAEVQLALDVHPICREGEGTKSVALEVTRHRRCVDSMRRLGVERMENLQRLSLWFRWLALLVLPILHDHRDGRRTAAILRLRNEGDVEPQVRGSFREDRGTYAEGGNGKCRDECLTQHPEQLSPHRDDDQDKSSDADQDDEQIAVAD